MDVAREMPVLSDKVSPNSWQRNSSEVAFVYERNYSLSADEGEENATDVHVVMQSEL